MTEIDEFIKISLIELRKGVSVKRHPFRYFTFSTTDGIHPFSRTVVLRKILSDHEFLVFTDQRSSKVAHLQHHPLASCLFYHPKQQLQMELLCEVRDGTEEFHAHWNGIPETSRKDYSTTLAPGSNIQSPLDVSFQEPNHFHVLKCFGFKMNLLKLRKEGHLRAACTWDGQQWQGSWLVP